MAGGDRVATGDRGWGVSDGRFVGVGVDEYTGAPDRRLDHAVQDVVDLAELIAEFSCDVLRNPLEDQVRDRLRGLKGSMSGGRLVVVWSGHGFASKNDNLRLLASDSDQDAAGGFGLSEVAGPCALSGASQILFVIDTCYSGA